MDINKPARSGLQAEIFRLLCMRAGQRLNLREMARTLKASPTAVSNALAKLEKEGLVSVGKSKTMNLLSIGFNRESGRAIELKRVENLKMVYESGLSDFLSDEFPGCTVMLFGSYSRGEDVYGEAEETRSDIDIAVIGTKGKKTDLAKFERLLERAVSINFYESWGKIHRNLKNNILSGILLKGSVEL